MPICSYVVFPRPGTTTSLSGELTQIPGCEVLPATNQDLLLLTTDTATAVEEEMLQRQLNTLEDIQCMILSFGDIDPNATMGGTRAFRKSKSIS